MTYDAGSPIALTLTTDEIATFVTYLSQHVQTTPPLILASGSGERVSVVCYLDHPFCRHTVTLVTTTALLGKLQTELNDIDTLEHPPVMRGQLTMPTADGSVAPVSSALIGRMTRLESADDGCTRLHQVNGSEIDWLAEQVERELGVKMPDFEEAMSKSGELHGSWNDPPLGDPPVARASSKDESTAVLSAIQREDKRLPFVRFEWFRERRLPDITGNLLDGQAIMQGLLDEEWLETYHVENPNNPQYPTSAVRLTAEGLAKLEIEESP